MHWNAHKQIKGFSALLLAVATLLTTRAVIGATSPDSPASLFAQGNADYQKGNFAAAEQRYRQLLDSGVDSGALCYNLGNSCFKQKKLGEAIYYWEKAAQKLPGDTDIRENLELANLMVVDRVEVPPDPLPVRVFLRAQGLLTVNQAAWAVLALFVAANLLFSLYLIARNPGLCFRALIGSLMTASLFLLAGCSLTWRIYDRSRRVEGIVVEQKADVRSGPGTDNITVFTVHEGITVRVRGEAAGWYQVSLPNGWNGWMQAEAVRIL